MGDEIKLGVENIIRIYWEGLLEQVPVVLLEKPPLDAETRVFLQSVGLPVDMRLKDYLGLKFSPHDIRVLNYRNVWYIAIGKIDFDDISQDVCIKENSGETFILDVAAENWPQVQFANSNIISFMLFLQIWLSETPHRQELVLQLDSLVTTNLASSKERVLQYKQLHQAYNDLIESIKRKYLEIDAKALSSIEYYWATILGDV